MHVVIDGLVIAGSYWLAWVLKFIGPFAEGSVRSLSWKWYMAVMVHSSLSDPVLCL